MIPNIQWGQTSEYILFKVLVKNVKNLSIDFNNNKLVFVGYSLDQKYNINVNFYKDIDENLCNHSYKIYESHIECKIKKKINENWHWLIQNQSFYKNHIKTDWNLLSNLLCLNESESPTNDLDEASDPNLSSILQSLQEKSGTKLPSNLNLNELNIDDNSDSDDNGLASGESTSEEDNELIV